MSTRSPFTLTTNWLPLETMLSDTVSADDYLGLISPPDLYIPCRCNKVKPILARCSRRRVSVAVIGPASLATQTQTKISYLHFTLMECRQHPTLQQYLYPHALKTPVYDLKSSSRLTKIQFPCAAYLARKAEDSRALLALLPANTTAY